MPATDEAVELAVAAADAADDRKATDVAILEVADILGLVDVFLLATASSDRQLKAVADRIEERLRDDDRRVLRREGTPASGWILLDYGDLVCHVLTAEQREFYDLERLWADVPRRDVHTGQAQPAPAAGQPTPRTQGADASPEGGPARSADGHAAVPFLDEVAGDPDADEDADEDDEPTA